MKRFAPLWTLPLVTAAAVVAAIPVHGEDDPQNDVYLYRSVGKRDPFQPPAGVDKNLPAPESEASPAAPRRIKEPLEAFQIDSLKLVAILRLADGGETLAMVQDRQGKGYLIRKGEYIGTRDGQIREIGEGGVVIQEPPQTVSGSPRMITLRLHEEKAP